MAAELFLNKDSNGTFLKEDLSSTLVETCWTFSLYGVQCSATFTHLIKSITLVQLIKIHYTWNLQCLITEVLIYTSVLYNFRDNQLLFIEKYFKLT